MTASGIYHELDSQMKGYVDALVEHAESALWPERKEALASFYRGIVKSDGEDLNAVLARLGLEDVDDEHQAEMVFRIVLTAYLERLDDAEVTNPDQAVLYSLSLDDAHIAAADRWLAEHPEHQVE